MAAPPTQPLIAGPIEARNACKRSEAPIKQRPSTGLPGLRVGALQAAPGEYRPALREAHLVLRTRACPGPAPRRQERQRLGRLNTLSSPSRMRATLIGLVQ